MTARKAIIAFFAATAIVHAIVAFWTPLQAEDWNQLIWNARHGDDGALAWLVAHRTFADAVGYVLARCHAVHVIVSPAVWAALVVGLYAVAARRLPRATWSDALALVVTSASLWIAQPHPGVAWSHIPSVALHVYGAAVAVWLVAALRCGWNAPRAWWPVVALAGYCAGSSARAVGTATLVGFVAIVAATPRAKRRPWAWLAIGALVIGNVVGYTKAPLFELARVVRRGFEPNLVLLKQPFEGAGKLVTIIALLALGNAALRARADASARPDPTETLRWMIAWIVVAVWCLFGPRYYYATVVPATCLAVIAVLPYFTWLASARHVRTAIAAIAIGVHVVVWPIMLATYHRIGDDAFARMTVLDTTPRGEVARVTHFSQVLANDWFFGEDLEAAQLRQAIALEVYGARDLAMLAPFRRYGPNPEIAVALEVDGASPADVRAAAPPPIWSGAPAEARDQFALFVKRLQAVTRGPVTARLVATNVTFTERGARPLLVAWVDGDDVMIPRTAVSTIDENNEVTVRVYGSDARQFDEAWWIDGTVAKKIPFHGGTPRERPLVARLNVFVACNARRCLLADALVPRF